MENDKNDVVFIDLSSSSTMESPNTTPARAEVWRTLEYFDTLRSEANGGQSAVTAGKTMRQQGLWINREKYFGHVPGVEVGDTFRFRVELCIIGLHRQLQGGIAWVSGEENRWGEPVANSIVLSGGYEDDDAGDSFVYHGSGGNRWKTRDGADREDQSLDKGNLALANACLFQMPVRVIRGLRNRTRKYRYDGLYRVMRFWEEVDENDTMVYKFLVQKKGPTFDRKQVAENLLKYRT